MTALADPAPPQTRAGSSRRLPFVVPPLLAYLAGHVLYLAAAVRTGTRYVSAAGHERWDSALYLQIAGHGYQMFHCDEDPHLAFYGHAWCGNAGWFPMYPWLIQGLHLVTGLSVDRSAVLVVEAATLAMLLAFWWVLVRVVPTPEGWYRNAALLALVVVFPVGVYFHAVFPMSLCLAATLLCLGLAARGRFVWAGVLGAVAAASYPVGFGAGLAAVAVALWGRRFLGAIVVGGLSATGLALVFLTMQVSTGHWNGFFLSQDKYGGQRHNPVTAFLNLTMHTQGPPYTPTNALLNRRLDLSVRTEMWVGLGLVLVAAAVVVTSAARRRLCALDAGLFVFSVVVFVVPLLAGTQISQYRSHALLLPAVLLWRRLPAWVLWALVVPAGLLAYRMGTLFYLKLLF